MNETKNENYFSFQYAAITFNTRTIIDIRIKREVSLIFIVASVAKFSTIQVKRLAKTFF